VDFIGPSLCGGPPCFLQCAWELRPVRLWCSAAAPGAFFPWKNGSLGHDLVFGGPSFGRDLL